MISGAMPKWRQWYHLCACALMCLLFAGAALFAAFSVFGRAPERAAPRLIATVAFVTLAIAGIVMLIRSRRRLIRQFRYDGRELRFDTLGASGEQIWPLPDIVSVRQAEGGRGPGMGYRITHRDKRYVILDYAVENSAAAAIQMEIDLGLGLGR